MGLTTKEKAERAGWKVGEGKDGKEIKIIMEPGGYNPVQPKLTHKTEDNKMVKTETREESKQSQGDSEQIPTDFWIGRTHSGKDLILVLKGITQDENKNPIDRVFLANPRDVRDVINGDWSGARLRELVKRK